MMTESKIGPMEILLVEDGWTDARVTIYALRRSKVHHRLTLVRTVSEAVAFVRREGIFARAPRPDLVLLDMMLPDGCGLDVMEALHSPTAIGPDGNGPTTVVLTASTDPELRRRCDELKVHDYMTKPVREDEFMRVVRDHKKLMIHTTPLMEIATV
ncbi:Response regulator rcp1 [Rubripirellula lacrimiformis]|uniref:Response regulator rcp1 n=1 Tax=Rubripirellula lacrimiformis TaxID=1930273 RepID=A0A517NDT8_9BACT|nr:response regulator [Rubripirellula lacrimiformis]QDT05294.1 Response regulator rcp1 [Rubripirellula lacrimiformis]